MNPDNATSTGSRARIQPALTWLLRGHLCVGLSSHLGGHQAMGEATSLVGLVLGKCSRRAGRHLSALLLLWSHHPWGPPFTGLSGVCPGQLQSRAGVHSEVTAVGSISPAFLDVRVQAAAARGQGPLPSAVPELWPSRRLSMGSSPSAAGPVSNQGQGLGWGDQGQAAPAPPTCAAPRGIQARHLPAPGVPQA